MQYAPSPCAKASLSVLLGRASIQPPASCSRASVNMPFSLVGRLAAVVAPVFGFREPSILTASVVVRPSMSLPAV